MTLLIASIKKTKVLRSKTTANELAVCLAWLVTIYSRNNRTPSSPGGISRVLRDKMVKSQVNHTVKALAVNEDLRTQDFLFEVKSAFFHFLQLSHR
jgi:hypothetical protein